ncbi:nitroimidazol reductase NimA-like FMN-containing flavoprotein (pyridoxamine 5'-phosphate oxidase superfamily) [Oikeobacillus pervagus]|uniref:Nitroimidazol reductase NimA-like FMN-containing flavoprotein (Pyridoxamine 5'-phosphate oxidase superfamily) n=1 Tax=Oikeobacillus pervagus TaxID=1325931 RepID=A0AAJ1T055_9BACI|nr:pyridoxamine 5'-phosphate oxidase family protein [Oikeobacillus pervagus]MDQ0215993.1 nitroimidazol reductase NimA-like FMN-containing flavoprotein (pyridoxamine 5'-phosphate oxidase superfamily) [Oikeobacillus pervagus]
MRGIVQNKARQVSEEKALQFLKEGKVAHVATVGDDGYPYVIPLVYIYEQGDKLFLHIGNLRESHFRHNIEQNEKICIEVSEMGDLIPGKRYACQSALVYMSVVLFGNIRLIEDDKKKEWFFDRLLEKYGNPEWSFEKSGYPALHKIQLFEVSIEQITGKLNEGFTH